MSFKKLLVGVVALASVVGGAGQVSAEFIAWAVGQGGKILNTTDGGANWNAQNSGGREYLRNISSVILSPAGDVNLDGDVNGPDVDPFVEVLLNGTDDNATRVVADMNLDGEVNGLDVDPFVDVLLSGPYQAEADMNADQVVNGLDVDPFVAAVVGGDTHQIPEPSTLLLALVALGVVGGWRKWGVSAQVETIRSRCCGPKGSSYS